MVFEAQAFNKHTCPWENLCFGSSVLKEINISAAKQMHLKLRLSNNSFPQANRCCCSSSFQQTLFPRRTHVFEVTAFPKSTFPPKKNPSEAEGFNKMILCNKCGLRSLCFACERSCARPRALPGCKDRIEKRTWR